MELSAQQMLISVCFETDNPYDYDYDNNDSLNDDRNRVYLNRRKLNFKGKKRREFDSSNPYLFLFMILFILNWV